MPLGRRGMRKTMLRCTRCGTQDERTLQGYSLCQECNDHHRTVVKERQTKKIKEHLCISCGKQDERTLQGNRLCEICNQKEKERSRKCYYRNREKIKVRNTERYHQLKSEHCCVTCGEKLPENYSYSTCKDCRNKKNQVIMNRSNNDQCERCGAQDKRTLQGFRLCETCYLKDQVRQADRNARLYVDRHENHKCATCGAILPQGYTKLTCEACRQKNRERRDYLKSEHLCVACKQQDAYTLNGHARCGVCQQKLNEFNAQKRQKPEIKLKQKEYMQNLRNERKKAGLCMICGKKLAKDYEFYTCPTCRQKNRASCKKRREAKGIYPRVPGVICSYCNKAPVMEGKKVCKTCYDKLMSRLEKGKPMKEQALLWRRFEKLLVVMHQKNLTADQEKNLISYYPDVDKIATILRDNY